MGERRLSRRALLLGGAGAGALAVGGGAWYASRLGGPAELLWRHALTTPADALDLAGDTLLVAGRGLTGYAAADGAVRWRQDAGRNVISPGRSGTAPFTGDRDAFAFRTESDGVATIRVAGLGDGRERWRRPFEGYLGSTLITAAGTVVASADASGGRGVGCYDATGLRWWTPVPAADEGPYDLAADGATLLVAARELAACDPADGTRRWSVAGEDGRVFGRPVLRGGVAVALGMRYIDDDFGYRNLGVYAVDTAAGAVRWSYEAPGGFLLDGPPPLAGGTVVAVHESGLLTGLDLGSGRERWSSDRQPTDLAALGARLWLALPEGVVALDAATGEAGAVLPERNAYRLAAAGDRLAVAADGTLSMYRIR
ncbi:PQQ-binding-like beta-propeller repeat protein [Dactylosporangium sp. CA-139066]|uniref:outer membrane protein assembly factor BamB family protein n=1 Tax=Dactylosporangium sp. CA-139066 TaxID=3239930 RepID=UPI003D8B41A8